MNTNDTNGSSTSSEEDMSMIQMGAAALGQLGLSSMDEQTDQAITAAIRLLSALDEREPGLGIREQMQAALKAPDPIAAIGQVLERHRDQFAS